MTSTGPFIVVDQIKTGEFKQFVNGALKSQATHSVISKPNAMLYIGNRHGATSPVSNGYWYGDHYEVMIFDKVLTDSERKEITAYLAKKWG